MTINDDLRREINALVERAVEAKLAEILVTRKPMKREVWITQNRAQLMTSRRKLERAMELGLVRFEKKDMNKRFSRVMVNKNDVEKIINKAFI